MVFLDINTFHGPKAGGIRTYHRAKLDWFAHQSEHVYCLIYPGPACRVERPSPGVYLVQVYGPALTSDTKGYRLILDYGRILKWVRKLRPDVIEAGDPWLTSGFCLWLRAAGLWNGLLVSFYHSDPVPSYLVPWAERGKGRGLRRDLAAVAASLFFSVQRRFDWTATASRTMEEELRAHGVPRIRRLPFGVPSGFFSSPRKHSSRRLLYAGRLDRDKGIELLLQILPALLEDPSCEVTVAGRGSFADRFAEIHHPRFHFAGFLTGEAELAALYASHDVFLAPGPHETFGLAVLEAMASGMIVVGPDASGTGELLRELNSPFQFPAGDAGKFLEKIRAAVSADSSEWAERHREVALRYGTWENAIGRMVSTWKELAR